ncbi:hypothetical protein Anas_05984 [Armadillidium nasatum]|uniref:Uncharacterized protein n=1 Tax=Armadillidium nasatum TaxID=96803 RepID=A0A5N5SWH6_9CRUS|nr:hypothetical protein Anas_05984 [Armadillidium nasatum]
MPLVTHPYTIYHLRKKQVNPNCNSTQSRYEWERCTDKKEREIILRETFQIAKEKATEENVYDYLKCFRIRDVRDYLGILLGIEYPPNRPYFYYQRKCNQIKNVKGLTKDQKYYIKMRFNRIPFRKQLLYLKRFLDHWLGFFFKLKKWKIKNNDFFDETLAKIAVTFPRERKKRLLKEKLRRKKFFELCMPHTRSDFADAPEPPPALTSVQLFQLMLASEGGPKDEDVIRNAFEKLPLIIQNSIEDKVIDIREEFRTKLLNYVCAMTETRLKLFLGLKREYYFKLFFVRYI